MSGEPEPTRGPARTAQLAILLEVAGTPKPGNVDRERDLDGLRFEHFLAGAVGALPGLERAAAGDPLGRSFERAVGGMADQRGGNTQFGSLLLLVPLVQAATTRLDRDAVERVLEESTVEDAVAFVRAFDHVDVFVGEPPPELDHLDVREPEDAIAAIREEALTLRELLTASAPHDDVAREWATGFERSFAAAGHLYRGDGPSPDRTAETFLWLLADRPDSLVAKRHGDDVAAETTERAAELLEDDRIRSVDAVERFADDLVRRGINPGTTADLVAAGLFVALERELVRV